jgi:hypothetical protein
LFEDFELTIITSLASILKYLLAGIGFHQYPRISLHFAGQGGASPSSSHYFGSVDQDAHSVFGGMDEDIMHDLINNGSMANGAYTREQGEVITEEEEEVEEEEEIRLSPPHSQPRQRERRRRRRREKAAEVRSGGPWRMSASPRHGRQ